MALDLKSSVFPFQTFLTKAKKKQNIRTEPQLPYSATSSSPVFDTDKSVLDVSCKFYVLFFCRQGIMSISVLKLPLYLFILLLTFQIDFFCSNLLVSLRRVSVMFHVSLSSFFFSFFFCRIHFYLLHCDLHMKILERSSRYPSFFHLEFLKVGGV